MIVYRSLVEAVLEQQRDRHVRIALDPPKRRRRTRRSAPPAAKRCAHCGRQVPYELHTRDCVEISG